ncbi:MAG TPA: FAD:protein FMN transferase [Spirochaetota bacterium]|nr:FAD:protein FMN transferase [Spirochaetota bacterium]
MKNKLLIITATTIFCSMVFLSCKESHTYRVGRPLIGTLINLTIVTDSEAHAAKAAEAAFAEIARIESLFSPFRKESDVFRMNAFGGTREVPVSDESLRLLKQAVDISAATDGAFDVTFATLSGLWRVGSDPFVPPSGKRVQELLQYMGADKILLSLQKKSVRFKNRKTKIGLGGIAKGYAILRAIEVLRAHGITKAIVDAGGDVQVLGSRDGSPWRVGLIHPRTKNIIAVLALEPGQSVATSGDYERFSMYKGRRYHHIIDPRTGFPAEGMASVSVLCSDPVAADAYATAFFVMGMERARGILSQRKDLQAIIIDNNMKIYVSKGLKGQVTWNGNIGIAWL